MKRIITAAAALAVAGGTLGAAMGAQASPAAPATGLPSLTLTLTAHAMKISGPKTSGATQVVVRNRSRSGLEPVFVQLNPGVTLAQVERVLKSASSSPDVVRRVGAIVFDPLAPTGTTRVEVYLPAATYVALVLPANGNGGPVGPPQEFTISKSSHPAALPKPAATVVSIDFGFRGATTLRSGSMVRFRNDGYLVHMFVIIKPTHGQSAAEVARLLKEGKDNQIRATFPDGAGAGPLSWLAGEQQTLRLRPGKYVVACFMDTESGVVHTRLGMERVLTVVR